MTNPFQDPRNSQPHPPQCQKPYPEQPYPRQQVASTPAPNSDVLSLSLRIFGQNAGVIIGAGFAYVLLLVLVSFVPYIALLYGTTEILGVNKTQEGILASIGVAWLVITTSVLMAMYVASLQRQVDAVWNGAARMSFAGMFGWSRVGMVFLATLVLSLLGMLGLVALIIGILVVLFFFMYLTPAAQHRSISAAMAISTRIAKQHVAETAVFVLLYCAASFAESMTFGLAYLATAPLKIIVPMVAYLMWRGPAETPHNVDPNR